MSHDIHLRLYEELNEFLPPGERKRRFPYRFKAGFTVGKLLAELRVPPGRVELVLINGDPAAFSDILKPGDFVSMYPVFESFDVSELVRVRERPLRRTRFLAGPRLVRLACYLRQLGFNTINFRSWPPEKIIRISEAERRIVLTRNSALLKSREFSRIFLVKKAAPRMQLIEILSRFDLYNSAHPARLRSIFGNAPIPGAGNQ